MRKEKGERDALPSILLYINIHPSNAAQILGGRGTAGSRAANNARSAPRTRVLLIDLCNVRPSLSSSVLSRRGDENFIQKRTYPRQMAVHCLPTLTFAVSFSVCQIMKLRRCGDKKEEKKRGHARRTEKKKKTSNGKIGYLSCFSSSLGCFNNHSLKKQLQDLFFSHPQLDRYEGGLRVF